MSCLHRNFVADVKVNRLTDGGESPESLSGFTADLEIYCADCYMPFEFIGMPIGVSPTYPTTNVDKVEARIPIRPVLKDSL